MGESGDSGQGQQRVGGCRGVPRELRALDQRAMLITFASDPQRVAASDARSARNRRVTVQSVDYYLLPMAADRESYECFIYGAGA